MTCIEPPELTDEDLLSFLDGQAKERVTTHLARCPACHERATRLRQVERRIGSLLYRVDCPSTMEIGDYHIGLLPTDLAERIRMHISGCQHCEAELTQLSGYLAALKTDLEVPLVEKTKALVARLLRGPGLGGQLSMAPALAGLRGAGEHSYVYGAGDAEIVIEVQSDPKHAGRRILLGLVTGKEIAHGVAHLWRGGERQTTLTIDELGNFSVPDLAPGGYELILSAPDVEIHLPPIEV